ncbi:hypothetical protein SGCZBJ_12650 [Caulobacter zeae]|uniref:Uncharacterized protein n=1 Tax=Caulobacter zeae TaxID=2055137 RepID=A0A2N5DG88_9CAUL|nr:hypothetical protein SGCZBJ_12650 [Caulobacter zeae]
MDEIAFVKWIGGSSALASWVQAVGSIAAIAATALVTIHGTRETRRAIWREQRDAVSRHIDALDLLGNKLFSPTGQRAIRSPIGGIIIILVHLIFKAAGTSGRIDPREKVKLNQFIDVANEHCEAAEGYNFPSHYDRMRAVSTLQRFAARARAIIYDIEVGTYSSRDGQHYIFVDLIEICVDINEERRAFRALLRSMR